MTFEEWTKQVKQAIKNKNKKQLDWLTAEWLPFDSQTRHAMRNAGMTIIRKK